MSDPNPNRCPRDSDRRDPNPKRTRGIVIVDSASHGCSTPGPRDSDMRSRVTGISTGISTPPVKPLLVILRLIARKALLVPQELW